MNTEWSIGQKVLLCVDRRQPVEVEVTRIGRTIVYITHHGRERGFYIENGCQNDHRFGAADYITTPERMAATQHRSQVIARLYELGLTKAGYGETTISTTALEAIVQLLEQEAR